MYYNSYTTVTRPLHATPNNKTASNMRNQTGPYPDKPCRPCYTANYPTTYGAYVLKNTPHAG